MSCQEYFERVKNIVEVIKSLGSTLADDMHLEDELPEREPRGGYMDEQKRLAKDRIHDKTIAYGLLVRADRGRYGKLIEEVENDFLKGHDDYPKTPTEAYNLLVNYWNYMTVNNRNFNQGLDQVAFVTEGKRQRTDGDTIKFPHIKGFKCGQFGHYKSDCPGKQNQKSGELAVTLTTLQVTLVVIKEQIDPMWILCDSESTVDIFKNGKMLTDIGKTRNPIRIKGIDGNIIEVKEEGTLLGYGRVYYHPQVAANMMSFFNMAKRFQSVTYNNRDTDAFRVMRDDRSVMEFVPSKEGLYYYDYNVSIEHSQKNVQ
jgi:hypothetical protein